MPTINNLAPIAPFMTINWWSGYFHRVALSYTTMTQQEYPIMAEVFNDDFLNHTPCFSHDPIPVVSAGDPDITQPMNNVEASAEIEEEGIRVHLLTNMVDLEGFQMLGPDDQWQAIKAEPAGPARFDLLWRPESLGVLTLQGINTAGVTSPKIVIQLSTMEVGL
jgi:hypothetical protein